MQLALAERGHEVVYRPLVAPDVERELGGMEEDGEQRGSEGLFFKSLPRHRRGGSRVGQSPGDGGTSRKPMSEQGLQEAADARVQSLQAGQEVHGEGIRRTTEVGVDAGCTGGLA